MSAPATGTPCRRRFRAVHGHVRRLRFVGRASVLAIATVLLVAVPAGAHPFVRGGEVPVDSLATMTLAMSHGCESEAEGEGLPTTDVALEVPEWLRVVDVPAKDGWSVELEQDAAGSIEVVTWTADGEQDPVPQFDLDVVATGEVGAERYLRVFQACDDAEYRWVGTPDAPAEDPAIGLTLTEIDPSSPPPPEPAPEPSEPDADPGPDPEPTPETESPGTEAEPTPEPDPTPEPESSETEPPVDDPEAAADRDPGSEDGSLPGWVVPVTIVALLGGIGALIFGRRGRSEP